MTKKKLAAEVVSGLEALYPDALCSLSESEPYRLLIAVRLSAQCTDKRVNEVTPVLFERFPTLDSLCETTPEEIGEIIKSCGLFNTKARDIHALCNELRERFGSQVPGTMEELLSLPGVGRKTANLILGDVFGQPAIVADTHCIRISGKLGLSDGTKDPYKLEMQLRAIVAPEKGNGLCHRLVLFGRDTCTARSPKCGSCPLADICKTRLDELKLA